jgi:four helix bundle protein
MGARDFTELTAWQLSKELHLLVLPVIARPAFFMARKLREQLDDAAASAPRNIAEGFGRFSGVEFAQFLKVALGSLAETRNHLMDARDRGYITEGEQKRADLQARRAIAATTALRSYLLSPRNKTSDRRTYKPHRGSLNP